MNTRYPYKIILSQSILHCYGKFFPILSLWKCLMLPLKLRLGIEKLKHLKSNLFHIERIENRGKLSVLPINFLPGTLATNLAIWWANFTLSLRVQTTLLESRSEKQLFVGTLSVTPRESTTFLTTVMTRIVVDTSTDHARAQWIC